MNEYIKILNHLSKGNNFSYPFCAKGPELSYKILLKDLLEKYIHKIKTLRTKGDLTSWLKENIDNFQSTNNSLIESLDDYLNGSSGEAYQNISNLLNGDFLQQTIGYLKYPLNKRYLDKSDTKSLFRVRYSDSYLENRSDAFHIPFDKRYLVKTQRYSLAGIPSLYLGSSLYVCWQEMGKPDLNKLHLSHYKINRTHENNDISVLNFAYSLETLKPDDLEHFLMLDF